MSEKKLEQRIEIKVDQDIVECINHAYSEEVTYWRKAALESILTNSEEKKLIDLALQEFL